MPRQTHFSKSQKEKTTYRCKTTKNKGPGAEAHSTMCIKKKEGHREDAKRKALGCEEYCFYNKLREQAREI